MTEARFRIALIASWENIVHCLNRPLALIALLVKLQMQLAQQQDARRAVRVHSLLSLGMPRAECVMQASHQCQDLIVVMLALSRSILYKDSHV